MFYHYQCACEQNCFVTGVGNRGDGNFGGGGKFATAVERANSQSSSLRGLIVPDELHGVESL